MLEAVNTTHGWRGAPSLSPARAQSNAAESRVKAGSFHERHSTLKFQVCSHKLGTIFSHQQSISGNKTFYPRQGAACPCCLQTRVPPRWRMCSARVITDHKLWPDLRAVGGSCDKQTALGNALRLKLFEDEHKPVHPHILTRNCSAPSQEDTQQTWRSSRQRYVKWNRKINDRSRNSNNSNTWLPGTFNTRWFFSRSLKCF